jgi:hypothetical protein
MSLDLPWFPAAAMRHPPSIGHSRPPRRLASGIALGVLLLGSTGNGGSAAQGTLNLRCTNPASGTSWQVAVDLDHGRVDSFPATINDKWISWHDPKQGFFDLERSTGKLQVRNASSTGGYFLYYMCRLQ